MTDSKVPPAELDKATPTELVMWCVYDHPKDYPNFFAARRWAVDAQGRVTPGGDVLLARTLNSLRSMLPDGFTNIGRYLKDDPNILEVWI